MSFGPDKLEFGHQPGLINKYWSIVLIIGNKTLKSLDFESKLCYCYDCDQPKNFIGLNLPTRVGLTDENKPKFTKVITPPPPKPETEEMNVTIPHPIRKG